MLSRLDRLFLLLDTGSSAVTRRAAANQIGEVQKLHPHELHNLLRSVNGYLESSSWETRIAAGLAVEAILNHVPQWTPVGCLEEKENDKRPTDEDKLSFDSFDLGKVVANSAYLMGSEGKEYDITEIMKGQNPETLAKQKDALNAKLGLNAAAQLGFDTNCLYSAEDLKIEIKPDPEVDEKKNVGEVVGLSCRVANREKRKARQAFSKQRSRDLSSVSQMSEPEDESEPDKKKIKLEPTLSVEDSDLVVPDNTGCWPSTATDWPLDWFCSKLFSNLFSPRWEIRHGAGTGLRHLLKTQGKSGGKSSNFPQHLMDEAHQCWLENVALRLVCVLTLDRFGDFVCDQVVAPVRETCAQALGSAVNHMGEPRVMKLLNVLLQLLQLNDWESRHGGLLGIKYIFAVRDDLLDKLVPASFQGIHIALSDSVDDVGAVAGAALASAVPYLSSEQSVEVLVTLSSLIPDLDDLTPAANTFVPLLALLLNKPHISTQINKDTTLSELIKRLWSLMEHNNSSVRSAALQTFCSIPSQQDFSGWSGLLQPTLRYIFQRSLVEHYDPLHAIIERVWKTVIRDSSLSDVLLAACPYMTNWLCLAMQPVKIPFDSALLLKCKPHVKETSLRCKFIEDGAHVEELKQYIGGNETISPDIRETNALHARFRAAKLLGFLSTYIVQPAPGIDYSSADIESPIDCYVKVLLVYLNNKSALQRLVAGLVIAEWASLSPPSPLPQALVDRLLTCLTETIYFDEIAAAYTKLLHETKDFIALVKHYKVPFSEDSLNSHVFTLEQIEKVSGNEMVELITKGKLKNKVSDTLNDRRKSINNAVTAVIKDHNTLGVMTQAALAGALLMLGKLPDKFSPVVKPLMESIKKEENERLQALAAQHLSHLIEICLDRNPSPNQKIITNLCNYLRSDPDFTPKIIDAKGNCDNSDNKSLDCKKPSWMTTNIYNDIISLNNQQKTAERNLLKRTNSTGGRGPGRPPSNEVSLEELFGPNDATQKQLRTQRKGASLALTAIVSKFGDRLCTALPYLWDNMTGRLLQNANGGTSMGKKDIKSAEEIIGCLQLLEITAPAVHESLLPEILKCLPQLVVLLSNEFSAVRHMASRCIAVLASLDPENVMKVVINQVVPMLSASDWDNKRRGAVEALTTLLEKMQLKIVPYITFLVVPLLGRMSDQVANVRILATHTFADLIQIMPLDGINSKSNLPADLVHLKKTQRSFLEQLFNPSSIPSYEVPVPINAKLRSYQQAGVNWLAFLNKFKLHGILCDDMGLGKTLQSICILAGDHYTRSIKFQETKADDCAPLPSIVICPPTLTGHWVFEVKKFLSKKYLKPLQYAGPPFERKKLRRYFKDHNLIVASYDIVRKDIDFFSQIKWNYCILDEGHVIKNSRTKSTVAIKQLRANHRLILSGTPIQNNVLELWSLFDFLMPGFLGNEKQFTARYSKPILASRDPKSTPKEQEAGVLAMEALHRQVLPFVLRRMKEDVLKDLPPKITQDYYCDLSNLQQQLYEDFSKSQAHQSLADMENSPAANKAHIFQALRYLQSVCNHPKLALTPKHPQYESILQQLQDSQTSLSDINHAAKLPALKQLLLDCGIGVPTNEQDDLVVNQHRALIFCQLKAMLDILENDFFKVHMPSVSYLRLDGSVPAGSRNSVVTRFNNDPSIDVLLLTTQVGGLGLNLTGADTVIFIEHDWSPMRDLQAMDRAHRIGQKKVVNVYRLITRATLEEKIMGLQKFKMMTANTVISSENASLETMGTDKLLDLFSLSSSSEASHSRNTAGTSGSLKSVLETLPDLWEHKEYEDEYDMTNFLHNLKS